MRRRINAGGSAAQGGIEYQNRSAAWLAVLILAERDVHPPFELSADVTLDYIACETHHPIDDIFVRTSSGGHVFLQAKRRLNLEHRSNSEFAHVIDQVVAQFAAAQGLFGEPTLGRLVDLDRDRFVVAIGPRSSRHIKQALHSVVNRARLLTGSQRLSDCAINADERKALEVVLERIGHSYRTLLGREPDDCNKLQILRVTYLDVLDVEPGGASEREAKNLLRSSVLMDPTHADSAWDALVRETARYAVGRAGGDRTAIQQALLSRGIPVKSARSYRRDIERLAQLTTTTRQQLTDSSRILVGPAEVRIMRASTDALKTAVETTSIIVVGEPGAGKSGALFDLARALQDRHRDVVLLTVGMWEGASVSALGNEMHLEHDLLDVLINWPGAESGFLIVDALDAGRSEASETTFREIISGVVASNTRWRVVVSIRKFDLRYSAELSRLFHSRPPTPYSDPEFSNVCHLNVPTLDDNELIEIAHQSPALASLVAQSSPDFLQLLRVPFNLRLLAELLGLNIAVEDLTPIRSQVELLDRYWAVRVIGSDRKGDAREGVLVQAVERMVEKRSLRVERTLISRDPGASEALNQVLSVHLLVEWQPDPAAPAERYVLGFSHHILFDYAVARLLLRGSPESFVTRLRSDPPCVLAIRPSLVMHYQELWHRAAKRHQFWELALKTAAADGLPEIIKLIGPHVASELFAEIEDVLHLLEALNQEPLRDGAEKALRHLIGAAVTNPRIALIGPGAPPWCELAELASLSIRTNTANALRTLISVVCDTPDQFTPSQRASAGVAARRLFEFAMQEDANRWLLRIGLVCVCRTFESDLRESAKLLRRIIEPDCIREHGFELLFWLAREVERLAKFDPPLVTDIYVAAFVYQEQSDAPSPLDSSSLIHLVSNRKQDYSSALYALVGEFGKFLSQAPAEAIRALISTLEIYVGRQHSGVGEEPHEEPFEFRGRPAGIRMDYSSVWDEGGVYDTDEPVRMLNAFGFYLNELAKSGTHRQRAAVLDELAEINRLAVVWRRLLQCGASFPSTFGRDISSVGWAVPILTCDDTTIEVGRYLSTSFEVLDEGDRERIEQAILSIPRSLEERKRALEHKMRDRILGCLPRGAVVTDDARQALNEIDSRGGPPANVESRWSVYGGAVEYGEREYLLEKDVPVDAEPNRRIRELEAPLKEFVSAPTNPPPVAQQVLPILPSIIALRDALSRSDLDGVHPEQSRVGFLTLVEACSRAATSESISCEAEDGSLIKRILLEAAHDSEPQHDPDIDKAFDRHQSWGPAPRIEAAIGLVVLGRQTTCTQEDVLSAISVLSSDSVAAVRYQVALRLNSLYYTAPGLMWSIIEKIVAEEESRGVLQALLIGPFYYLTHAQPSRTASLAQSVLNRVADGDGAKEVRSLCVRILTDLYVWRGLDSCRKGLEAFIPSPAEFPDEVGAIVGSLRDALRHGEPDVEDASKAAIRHRAFTLLSGVLSSIKGGLEEFVRNLKHSASPTAGTDPSGSADPTNGRGSVERLLLLAEGISREVYSASGAYDDRAGAPPGQPIPDIVKRRFLAESRNAVELLTAVAELGIPRVAHELLQTLEYLADVAPKEAFLRAARVVRGVRASGYQHEQLAEELIIHVITRFLADYRILLQTDEDCRVALIEILDTFVEAGWSRARRLAYGLDIFR